MKMTMRKLLLLITLIPTIATAIIVAIGSVYEVNKSLYENQELIVKIAEEGFDGNVEKYKDLGIDLTVFEGDTRVESSIPNSVGTKASDIVIEEVLVKGNEYINRNVDVNGESYLGYYVPIEGGMLFAGKSNASIQDTLFSVVRLICILCIIPVVIFIIISTIISNKVNKIMGDSAKGLELIASGDLTHRKLFPKATIYENNKINGAALGMIDTLHVIVDKTMQVSDSLSDSSNTVNITAETVLSATNEISSAIEEIANGATRQSSSVQNMANSIFKMKDNTDETKQNIENVSNYSQAIEKDSKDMKEKINDAIAGMEQMNVGITQIDEQLQKTNIMFEEMNKFVGIINDIANQTKLLSLNASIEAARAGESGRGFSVVAETIKTMSEDTAKQSSEISDIIKNLIKDFAVCMESIKVIVNDNQTQRRNMNYVVDTFKVLDENINKTREKIIETEQYMDELAKECNAIASDAEDMTAIAENSAAATEEITASIEEVNSTLHNLESEAKELQHGAETLKGELKFFKI